jgi:hypothetical protein
MRIQRKITDKSALYAAGLLEDRCRSKPSCVTYSSSVSEILGSPVACRARAFAASLRRGLNRKCRSI